MTHISTYLPQGTNDGWNPPPGVCERCWEIHRCNTCHDGGRVRARLQVTDGNFGKSLPCPNCNGGSHEDAKPENPDDRMRVPMAYRDAALGKLTEEQRHAVQDVVGSRPSQYLVTIAGASGGGKTYAAICALRWHLNISGSRGAFWPVLDILARYRATFDSDRATETAEQVHSELSRCPLLVLDDWGKQQSTEWSEQQLFRILDERLRNQSRTIITTNSQPADLPPAVASRLFGNRARVVTFTKNWRTL